MKQPRPRKECMVVLNLLHRLTHSNQIRSSNQSNMSRFFSYSSCQSTHPCCSADDSDISMLSAITFKCESRRHFTNVCQVTGLLLLPRSQCCRIWRIMRSGSPWLQFSNACQNITILILQEKSSKQYIMGSNLCCNVNESILPREVQQERKGGTIFHITLPDITSISFNLCRNVLMSGRIACG